MPGSKVSRDSNEYAEILAEVLAETVRKSAGKAMGVECGSEEVTPALMECLQYVYLHGPSPIRQIAYGLEISLSAASQLVDRLVRKELATRRENQTDRRLTQVELTDTGRDAVRQMRQRKSEWFDSVLDSMPAERRRWLRDGLESFLEAALTGTSNPESACCKCGMEHVSFCVVNKVKNAAQSAKLPREESRL